MRKILFVIGLLLIVCSLYSAPIIDSWLTYTTDLPTRYSGVSTFFNGELYVMGGWSGPYTLADTVYASADGINWTLKSHLPSPLVEGNCWVFGGDLYVWGGRTATNALTNHTYKTSDGINWTDLGTPSSTPPYSIPAARLDPSTVVFNGAMWLINGTGTLIGGSQYNEVWTSTNGYEWELKSTPFASAYQRMLVQEDGTYIWAWSGYAGGFNYDIYRSSDGVTWSTNPVPPPISSGVQPIGYFI